MNKAFTLAVAAAAAALLSTPGVSAERTGRAGAAGAARATGAATRPAAARPATAQAQPAQRPMGRFEEMVAQGQLALDTDRPSEAVALFGRAASLSPRRAGEMAPDRAWAYVLMGNDALSGDDLAAADRHFSAADAAYPRFRPEYMEQWTFARMNILSEAVSAATRAPKSADWASLERDARWLVENMPGNSQPHFLLGVVYEFQERNDLAREEYATAGGGRPRGGNQSLSAYREAAENVSRGQRISFELRPIYPPWKESRPGPFQVYRQGPFVISHHNRALAERLARVLSYYLSRPVLGGVLAPNQPFPRECVVYIHANEGEFKSSGGAENWAAAQSSFEWLDGELTSAEMRFYQADPGLTSNSAPHELAHVRLVASAHFYQGLPLWLQEGVASSTESASKKEALAKSMAEARKTGSLIPFTRLTVMEKYPSGEGNNDLFYAESLAGVEALVRYGGRDKFWRFVAALEKQEQSAALRGVYNLRPVDLENLVLQWVGAHNGGSFSAPR